MSGNSAIGLVIPTSWEARDILRHYGFKSVGQSLFKAEIKGRPVWVCVSGVGREPARGAANRLVSSGATILVSVGFCGALVPELHVGDLITDRLISVDHPARTPDERRALTQRANALAVDMETQAVIETGTRRGVPIHMLRVISDEFSDDLTALLGKSGGFSAWKIAVRLLNPRAWPLARKLQKQSAVARRRLVEEVGRFLERQG